MHLSVVKLLQSQEREFIDFNLSLYPKRANALGQIYYKFQLQNKQRIISHLIAIDNDKIVGQIILLPTSCFYYSNKFNCVFACDYIVHPDYLNTGVGVKLLQKTIKQHVHFGIGVSYMSKRLHLVLKEKHVGDVIKYLFTKNIMSFFFATINTYLKFNIRKVPSAICWPQNFYHNTFSAERTKSLPFHNSVLKADLIEFSRNSEFMKLRFEPFKFKYSYYQLFDNKQVVGYVILRVELWRGMKVLIISDYRFNGESQIIDFILNIAKKIMRSNNLDSVLFGSSLKIIDDRLIANNFRKVGLPSEIFTNLPLKDDWETKAVERNLIFATPADSDFEFNLGDELWKN